jgi:hypothetical protein
VGGRSTKLLCEKSDAAPSFGRSKRFAFGGNLDFRNATIVIRADSSAPERKVAAMLSEEIKRRTQLGLKIETRRFPGPAIVLGWTD